jgi:CSLREA domain-containing protein
MTSQREFRGSRWVLALVAAIFSGSPAWAEVNFNVNTTMDQPDQDPGDGVCQTSSGTCSLRAAVMQANNLAGFGSTVIHLPAGNYVLSLGNGLYFGSAAHQNRSVGTMETCGRNFFGIADGCRSNNGGTLYHVTPSSIGSLQNNGGPTLSHALLGNSEAIARQLTLP